MLFKVVLHFFVALFAHSKAEAQVLYTDFDFYGTPAVPPSTPAVPAPCLHSTSAPVTHAKGAESVSLLGGATYTLPITVAPGTGGMQPTLAVTYNSQSDVSNMGMGWSLAAGSAIVRTNKTVAQDGAASAPTLAQTDAIALDGQRLVLLTGTYGTVNSVYTTESEMYSRITLLGGNLASVNAYFSVLTKNGMTIDYGANYYDYATQTWIESKAAFKASATTAALLWRISKTTDPFGNFMTYLYEDGTTTRSSYLTEIKYTGNANASPALTPYNKVTFTYNARTVDANTAYMCGATIKNDKKLTTITAFAEAAAFRKYDFTYSSIAAPALATDPSIPRTTEFITKIIESNVTTGTTFVAQNPVYFKYGDVPTIIVSTDPNLSVNKLVETVSSDPAGTGTLGLQNAPDIANKIAGYEYMSGDYNGDGYTDLLEIELAGFFDEYANPCYTDGDNTLFRFKEESYFSVRVLRNTPPTSNTATVVTNTHIPKFTAPYPAVNLVHYPEQYSESGCGAPYRPAYASHIYSKIVAANVDIDGDGKDDLVTSRFKHTKKYGIFTNAYPMDEILEFIGIDIYTNLEGTPVHTYYNSGISFYIKKWITTTNSYDYINKAMKDNVVSVGDFDGDGRSDILLTIANNGVQSYIIYPAKNDNIFHTLNISAPLNSSVFTVRGVEILDIDGDGKQEIGYKTISTITGTLPDLSAATDIYIYNTFPLDANNEVPLTYITGYNNIDHNTLTVADFNGDGKSDIYTTTPWGVILYSRGNSFHRVDLSFGYSSGKIIAADFNSDGKADIMYGTANSNRIRFSFSTGYGFVQTYRDVNNGENPSSYWSNGTNLGYSAQLMGIGDFNADGQPDFLSRNSITSSIANLLYVLPNQRHHLLHKVKDGLDNITEFQYRGLAQPLRTNQNFRLAGATTTNTTTNLTTNTATNTATTIALQDVPKSAATKVLDALSPLIQSSHKVVSTNAISGTYTPVEPPVPPPPPVIVPLDPQSTAYPLQVRKRAMTVVYRMTVPSGNSDTPTRSMLYQYGLPVINVQGRGFFGFQYMMTRDSITQIESKSQTTFNVNGAPLWQANYTRLNKGTVAAPNYVWYSRSTQLFEVVTDNAMPLRYVVRPTVTSDTNYVNRAYTHTYSSFSEWVKNNVAATATFVKPITPTPATGNTHYVTIGSTISQDVVSYNNYVSAIKITGIVTGIAALPTQIIKQKTLNNIGGAIIQTDYDYVNDPITGTPDNILGKPRKITIRSGGEAVANIKNLRYDAFGNVGYESVGYYISENDFGNRPPIRYKYEAKGRFVTHTANTLSDLNTSDIATANMAQVSKADYSGVAAARFGLPATTTDVAGLQTAYTYDAIGRTTQTIQNFGQTNALTTANVFTWLTPSTTNPYVYTLTSTEKAGSPVVNCSAETISYIDALERNRLTTSTNLQGTLVYTGIATYDNQGRVVTQTAPYLAGESSLAVVTTNVYHDFTSAEIAAHNQLKTVTQGNYTETAFAYATTTGGTTVTTTKTDKYTADGDGGTQITSKTVNQIGQTTSTTDAGGTMLYTYSDRGVVSTYYNVMLPVNEIIKVFYDGFGRQISLLDKNINPSTQTEYTYSNYGELLSQKDTKGNKYNMTYDDAGRMLTKTLTGANTGTIGSNGDNSASANGETTVYAYSLVSNTASATTGINQLVSETLQNHPTTPTVTIHKKVYTYNNLQQNTQVVETIGTEAFTTKYYYDACSRNMTTEYPKAAAMPIMCINRTYNANGYLDKIHRVADNTNLTPIQTLFVAGKKNAFGTSKSYTLNASSNGISITRDFDALGLPTTYKAGTAALPALYQDLSFKFETSNKNLTQRAEAVASVNKSEVFTFDGLDRLTSNKIYPSTTPGATPTYTNTTSFAGNGNITAKSDIGYYTYDASPSGRPNAIVGLTTPRPDIMEWRNRKQQILYTAFEQPAIIKAFTTSANTTFNQLNYTYGTNENRIKSVEYSNTTLTATRYYLGSYERLDIGTKSKRHIYYLGGGAIITYHENTETILPADANVYKTYYALTDHLGSIVKVIDANGTNGALSVAAEYNYDAGGRNRNAITVAATANTPEILAWSYPALGVLPTGMPSGAGSLDWLTRGYTGHEHLRTFALINMNGRMYDPALGQMLSPDNFAGLDGTTQSFNRYSYVMNNPLKYTDPSGELGQVAIGAIAGAVVGGYMGGVMANGGNFNPLQWDYNNGKTWGYMAAGAAVGALSGATGGFISQSGIPFANTVGTMASSFLNSSLTNLYTGGQTDITMSMGIASYNFTQGSFGFLGKPGNTLAEDIGYGFGALGNIQDAFALDNGITLDAKARREIAGHEQIEGVYDGKPILISVGPKGEHSFDNLRGIKWEKQFGKLQLKGKPSIGENVSYIGAPGDTRTTGPFITKLYNVSGKSMLK